jgi:peptidoglycan hydrolase-like protein with peptidoglycan-binding domain
MSSSSSLYIGSGTFNTNNHNITTGSINISGVDTRSINLGSSRITLTGTSTEVWGNTITTNQTFNPQTSTVILDGTNQSIKGSTSFYNLTKITPATDTLIFDANSTQTVTGTLTLQGAINDMLNLLSSISGTKWNINPTSRSLSYLNVSDSNNTNSTPIAAYSMTGILDYGNNTNWQFTTPISSSRSSSGTRYIPPILIPPTTAPAITNTSTTFIRDLDTGIQGDDVKSLQKFLNSKGYTVSTTGPGSIGNETDYFGMKTREALIQFQKQNNITPAIGYFGPLTRAVISKLLTNPTTTPKLTTFTRNLTLGSEGDDVTRLQTILNTQGYLTVSPTGYFGYLTLQAVKAYQKSKGISDTGYVGPLTRAELK